MQFRLQVQRQEFGGLLLHNRYALPGDNVLKLPCLFIGDILVILCYVGPGN